MTYELFKAAVITKVHTYITSYSIRTIHIRWDDDSGCYYFEENGALCEDWKSIQEFLDNEEGIIYLDRKCEVPLNETTIEIVKQLRAFDDMKDEGRTEVEWSTVVCAILKSLGQS